MPRKERIEYPGAVYHVISRGNYKKALFGNASTVEAFESCLFETVARCGWKLHAYGVMSNHYHLAVETPSPNLVVGMKWLQSVFATRFNRYRKERGHVFQGRYKALLVGEGRTLLGLVDYIHLNPVRAPLCRVEDLKAYGRSSYPRFFKKRVQEGLHRERFLASLDLPDSLGGMRRYAKHLAVRAESEPKAKAALAKQFCRGWFIGEPEEKAALKESLTTDQPAVVWSGEGMKDLNEAAWERLVQEALNTAGKSESDIRDDPKGVAWKAFIAVQLRARTTAGNPWIARRLNMGHPSRISTILRNHRAG